MTGFGQKETLAQVAMRIDDAALRGLSDIQRLEIAYKLEQFKKPDRPDGMGDVEYKIHTLRDAVIYRDALVSGMKVSG